MIAVLMSGGVDSFVAAHLLKKSGADVVGVHFKTGYENVDGSRLQEIAALAGVPLVFLDCEKEFKRKIVDYFIDSYLDGETPNPCIVCNRLIKFGLCADYAVSIGAEAIATGHYCSAIRSGNRTVLGRGADTGKEQSYFLAFLSQAQLSRAVFPLGNMKKSDVKKLAHDLSFPFLTQAESQDVCFIRDTGYARFIEEHAGMEFSPGHIQDTGGNIIGGHHGVHRFTIGQRRGINIPSSRPYYVAAIDTRRNLLTVGHREDLFVSEFMVRNVNWLLEPPDGSLDLLVMVRYNQTAVNARVIPVGGGRARVFFATPQFGVAPGQAAVFYDGDTVLGGGIITRDFGQACCNKQKQ